LSCGNCCKTQGRAYLYQADIFRLSKNLGISVFSFVNKYCEFRKEIFIFKDNKVNLEVLALSKNGDNSCIFLNDNKCGIHDFKPLQCLNSPFIDPIITDEVVWKEFIEGCCGFGKGKVYDVKRIITLLSQHKEERRVYYNWLIEHNLSLEKALGMEIDNAVNVQVFLDCNYYDYYESSNRILDSIFMKGGVYNE
jgi:Fe-S-cluster containining protein